MNFWIGYQAEWHIFITANIFRDLLQRNRTQSHVEGRPYDKFASMKFNNSKNFKKKYTLILSFFIIPGLRKLAAQPRSLPAVRETEHIHVTSLAKSQSGSREQKVSLLCFYIFHIENYRLLGGRHLKKESISALSVAFSTIIQLP